MAGRSNEALGRVDLPQEIIGTWRLPNYPELIVAMGRSFRKARIRQPYPGVVEQYREDVPTSSMHMKVYGDGHWVIDHIDADNPDHGRAIEHFFRDHPLGQAIGATVAITAGVVVVAAVIGGIAAAASALTKA